MGLGAVKVKWGLKRKLFGPKQFFLFETVKQIKDLAYVMRNQGDYKKVKTKKEGPS